MKGLIGFDRFEIHCIIGVEPEERNRRQTIYVDMRVEADFANCVTSDHIHDTVNYVDLANICSRLAVTRHYRLLETYVYEVLNTIMNQFNISWAWIRVKKPDALKSAEYTLVEFEKYREEL
jgi:dihydroneopterin aldolase